jgi:hypothetical protein
MPVSLVNSSMIVAIDVVRPVVDVDDALLGVGGHRENGDKG